MSSITIRGCCIGAGRPKVILPIVARTEDDILREARRLSALKADCIEWRADWFSDVLDVAARKRVLSGLRAALGEKLLLVQIHAFHPYPFQGRTYIKKILCRKIIFFLKYTYEFCNLIQSFFYFIKAVGEHHICHSLFAKRTEAFFF